jgi:hypothetical protein
VNEGPLQVKNDEHGHVNRSEQYAGINGLIAALLPFQRPKVHRQYANVKDD